MFGGLSDEFPNLHPQNYSITSPRKNRYNCIAWAAGCETRWWWPAEKGFWPEGIPREVTLAAFVAAFDTLGYEPCGDGSLEQGYEKIALFARKEHDGTLVPTHAAKQLSNGRWTSKLGALHDIEHLKVEDVNGPGYGAPVQFMSRPISPA